MFAYLIFSDVYLSALIIVIFFSSVKYKIILRYSCLETLVQLYTTYKGYSLSILSRITFASYHYA